MADAHDSAHSHDAPAGHDSHGQQQARRPSGRGLLSFIRRKPKQETSAEHEEQKGPVDVQVPNVPEYEPVFEGWYPAKIKYRGVYDLDGLYRYLANWLRQKRFEVFEELYKAKPPELEFRLTGERKATGFVMEKILIHHHSWGEYDVDVVVNGKKKKMTNARMIITISGEIRAPYEDIFEQPRWTASVVERKLLNLFRQWFYKRE